MAHADIPRIRIDISASPLVPRCHRASRCSEYYFLSDLTYSNTTTLTASANSSSSSLLSSSLLCSETCSDAYATPSRIPPTAIMGLLDLLDAFDADVEAQVAHAKENIKEVRALVQVAKTERVEMLEKARQKREMIKRGTLASDSEFWCSV